MGKIDRIIRIILGIILIYIGIIDTVLITDSLYRLLVAGFGILNIIFSIVSICPVYMIVDISSVGKKVDDAKL